MTQPTSVSNLNSTEAEQISQVHPHEWVYSVRIIFYQANSIFNFNYLWFLFRLELVWVSSRDLTMDQIPLSFHCICSYTLTDHSKHYLLKLWIKRKSSNRLFLLFFFFLSCARSELMQGGVGKTLTIWFQNSNKHKKCKGSNIGAVVCCNASLEPEIRKESFPLNWTLSAKTNMLVADCVSLEFSINSPHRWWKYIVLHTHESRTRAWRFSLTILWALYTIPWYHALLSRDVKVLTVFLLVHTRIVNLNRKALKQTDKL